MKCTKCGEDKPIENFEVRKDKGVEHRRKQCRTCMNKLKVAHYHKNTLSYKLREAKRRADKKGLDFSITEEDVQIPEFCPLLGIPLKISHKGASYDSPSIDRIDSNLGYIKGNVWVISMRANTVKNDACIEELELLVYNLRNRINQMGTDNEETNTGHRDEPSPQHDLDLCN